MCRKNCKKSPSNLFFCNKSVFCLNGTFWTNCFLLYTYFWGHYIFRAFQWQKTEIHISARRTAKSTIKHFCSISKRWWRCESVGRLHSAIADAISCANYPHRNAPLIPRPGQTRHTPSATCRTSVPCETKQLLPQSRKWLLRNKALFSHSPPLLSLLRRYTGHSTAFVQEQSPIVSNHPPQADNSGRLAL